MTTSAFKRKIWAYYKREGRTALPWRHTKDPYAILVSEIMLQQTQVARVEEYYARFLKRFPDFRSLARASTADVLIAWQGLGYNRRAIFLKKIAEIIIDKFGSTLPGDRETLESLPGIGKGTSGSLMAFIFNKPEIFIETNIRRVFIHFFFENKKMVTDEELKRYIESTIDRVRPREWYWALMDYGAAMNAAKRVDKTANPNRRSAHYTKQSVFEGSDRELRGKIVRILLARQKMTETGFLKEFDVPRGRLKKILDGLEKEGFIIEKGNYLHINK